MNLIIQSIEDTQPFRIGDDVHVCADSDDVQEVEEHLSRLKARALTPELRQRTVKSLREHLGNLRKRASEISGGNNRRWYLNEADRLSNTITMLEAMPDA